MNIFDFKNKHKLKVEIEGFNTLENATDYLSRITDAFKMVADVERKLSDIMIIKNNGTDIIVTTCRIPGKEFALRFLFSGDSKEPLSVNVVEFDKDNREIARKKNDKI